MVVLTSRFTLLAGLLSIAAISLLPPPVDAAAIQVRHQDALSQPIAARHSSHGHSEDDSDSPKHPDSASDMKASSSKVSAVTKNAADKPQRHPKPVVPLPARMAQKSVKTAPSRKPSGGDGDRSDAKESKHSKSRRAWNPTDPLSRMEQFWTARQDMWDRGMPTQLDKRHHHHHDHHDHDKVIVDGDNDHVNVHHRSIVQDRVTRAPHDDHDRVVVEGHDDHVHVHDADHHDDHDRVVVKGDGDHVHVHRSPSPHHHHDHDRDEVVVKGNHDSVHFHRTPEPAPHHHHHHNDHHDTVIVKGDDDHVKVHGRSPTPHHRHHKVVVKGNNQHVHAGRSPTPAPEHHSHDRHHGSDKVTVKGDHDHVNIHKRTFARNYPIVISGNRGQVYHVHPTSSQVTRLSGGLVNLYGDLHLRRDGQMNGVPGSIEIMSQVANSDVGERIASLVLAAPSNGTTPDNSTSSTFVLNASGTNSTQLYLVTAPISDVDALSSDSQPFTSTSPTSFIKVELQMPMFDAVRAQLRPYCATFDPRPAAPAAMTVEECMDGSSTDEHKSQVFAYEPGTGVIRPMWFDGEDDGTGGDDSGDSTVPSDDTSDDDGSDDDLGGTGNSTTVDPTTPSSNKVVNVTSLQQEALDEQYGDATRPPTRMASVKSFAADSSSGARNVTLVFSPATPEVPWSQGKFAASPSSVDGSTTSAVSGSAAAASTTLSSTATVTTLSSSATTAPATSSVAALDVTATLASSGASSDTASATSSSTTSTSSSTTTESTASASTTAPSALEVKVYNPYASDSVSASQASSSVPPTMTPVSTEPYEWMFKQSTLPELD